MVRRRLIPFLAVSLFLLPSALLVGLVEKEETPLVGLVAGSGGDVNGLHGGGVDAGVVHLGSKGHGRRGEVLYLLKPVAHLLHVEC